MSKPLPIAFGRPTRVRTVVTWLLAAIAVVSVAALPTPATAQLAPDMKLADAGFMMQRPNTPQKLRQMRKLPPHKFFTRTKKGRRYFVYSDPDYCKCVFVGDQVAFKAFTDMRGPLPQPDVVDADVGNTEPDGFLFGYRF